MALTRKMLTALGIEPEKIDQIIEGHSESVSGLRDELDKAKADIEKYKSEASKVAELQKELDTAKKDADTAKDSRDKYDKLKTEFDNYKAEQEKKEADAVKKKAFSDLLKDMKVSEKGQEMIFKWQGVDGVEVDESGKITNAKDLRKAVKEDWADYITTEETEGADTSNPPANEGGPKMTRNEIMAIKDRTERLKAIEDNPEVFGYKEI